MGIGSSSSKHKAVEEEMSSLKPSEEISNYIEEFTRLTVATETQLRNLLAQAQNAEKSSHQNKKDREDRTGKIFCDLHAILQATASKLGKQEATVEQVVESRFPRSKRWIRSLKQSPGFSQSLTQRALTSGSDVQSQEEIILAPEINNESQFPNRNPATQDSEDETDDTDFEDAAFESQATTTTVPHSITQENTQQVTGLKLQARNNFISAIFTDDESSNDTPTESECKSLVLGGEDEAKPVAGHSKAAQKKTKTEPVPITLKTEETTGDMENRPDLQCVVKVENMPKKLLDLFDNGQRVTKDMAKRFLKVESDKEDDTSDSEIEMDRALKSLKNFDGRVGPSRTNSSSSSSGENKVKPKRRKSEDSGNEVETGSESDSDTIVEAEPRASTQQALRSGFEGIPNANNSDDSDSDSEFLDAFAVVSDEESDAKRAVLLNIAKEEKRDSASDSEERSDTEDNSIKSKKKPYLYTPSICRLPSESDSEASDDSVSIITTKKRDKKRVVISSDSDNSDLEAPRRTKRSSSDEERGSSHSTAIDENEKTLWDLSTDCESDRSNSKPDVECIELEDTQRVPKRQRIISISDDEEDFKPAPLSSQRASQLPGPSGSRSVRGASGFSSGGNIQKKAKRDSVIILDSDEEEDDSQDSVNRGRKNIRDILGRSDLMRETQDAEDEEEERKRRLANRQREFNKIFKTPKSATVEGGVVILDFDEDSKVPLVSVDESIVKCLKPHQAEGITFMWNNCFESVNMYEKSWNKGGGCILAHCMGLGKTLQTVAFIHTVMTSPFLNINSVLVVCPLNTVHNWKKEFKMWLKDTEKRPRVHNLYDSKPLRQRIEELEHWRSSGGVGIINYEKFRNLVRDNKADEVRGKTQALKDRINKCLLDPGPDLIICDEGHIMKNFQSQMSIALNRVQTKRRVVLTGTPLQNNLMEYHTMMHFVKPNLLGTRKEFSNRFSNPITNGQHRDSTPMDVRIMKRRAHVLHKLLDPCVQRKDYTILLPYLPSKHEYAVVINMADVQKKLYNRYLELIGGGDEVLDRIKMGFFLGDFAALSKIWSHPFNLTLPLQKDKHKKVKKKKDEEDEEDDLGEADDIEAEVENIIPASATAKGTAKVKVKEGLENFRTKNGRWWEKYFDNPRNIKLMEHSTKFIVIKEILSTCAMIGDKVLIFSQYLYSLNLIEDLLKTMDEEERQKILRGESQSDEGRWRFGKEYYRIDGSVKSSDRQRDCEEFNSPESRAKLFLVSTKAGGVGINLVGANRVILFDASFNPSNDMQAIFRVFRFGQKKPCYIYRLLAKGTMEEKVYNRQVVKLSLSGRVVDEMQIERHYTVDELVKMYLPVEEVNEARVVPVVPKDKLLGNLLLSDKFKDIIHTYVEHDSLLQNKLDEKLTDQERNMAWEEYENERKGMRRQQNDFTGFADLNPDYHEYDEDVMDLDSVEPLPPNIDVLNQTDLWYRSRVAALYPHLTHADLNSYVQKAKRDMHNFHFSEADYVKNEATLNEGAKAHSKRVVDNLKGKIRSYFNSSTELRAAVLAESNFQDQVNHRPNKSTGINQPFRNTQFPKPSAVTATAQPRLDDMRQGRVNNFPYFQRYVTSGAMPRPQPPRPVVPAAWNSGTFQPPISGRAASQQRPTTATATVVRPVPSNLNVPNSSTNKPASAPRARDGF